MWQRIDRKLRSPILTVTLICVIGLASIIGTVPTQILRKSENAAVIYELLRAVGADHLYGTWWYLSLLVFLAFLMTYCSLRGLPSIIRTFSFIPDASAWPNREEGEKHSLALSNDSESSARERISRILKDNGYHLRSVSHTGEDTSIVFEKGRAGVLGPPLVHFGLVVVFIGGLITYKFGSASEINIGEGESYAVPGTEMTTRLEKFSIIHHPGTREPEEYVSSLMVKDKSGQPVWHLLRVNQPLNLSGISLYQMRYRPEVRHIRLAAFEPGKRSSIGIVDLVPGKKAELPAQNLAVRLEEIIPDFVVDSKNNVSSRSQYFLNPAARISLLPSFQGAEPIWTGWAFKGMFPAHNSPEPPLLFVIERVSLKYYSGIKIVRDPGGPVAYLGFAFLVGGTFLTCYVFRRFVRLDFGADTPNECGCVTVSGYSLKNRPDFANELQGLMVRLRKGQEV
ncbi:cytochrome c biogenesis protein ResB [Candidatus Poribacteria bacterium]|nr:cytochrome c biogenesis protein ResB [Candidatus Poribacteria bacterium]